MELVIGPYSLLSYEGYYSKYTKYVSLLPDETVSKCNKLKLIEVFIHKFVSIKISVKLNVSLSHITSIFHIFIRNPKSQ